MSDAEVDSKSEATDTEPGSAAQEQILNIMSYSQRGRMEEQRCSLSPIKKPQTTPTASNMLAEQPDAKLSLPAFNCKESGFNTHNGSTPLISVTECTPDLGRKNVSGAGNPIEVPIHRNRSSSIQAESPEEQQKFINMINQAQRGRMEDQCCSFDPSKSAPCTPRRSDRKPTASTSNSGPDSEMLFNLLANTQSSRLDDQRVTLPTLPGLGKVNTKTAADSSYLCYMVSKVQGSRMDDQRCSLPQVSISSASGAGPLRSASFNPSDMNRPKSKDNPLQKRTMTSADQEKFLSIMSHSQRGRMDEQRCVLNAGSQHTPKHQPGQANALQEPGKFFNLLADSQGRRFDDQRVTLPSLPGIQNGGAASASSAADKDASFLCYMVSKVQGSRMDEQRCSAPQIFQNQGASSVQHKDHLVLDTSGKPQRSASLSRDKADLHQQEISLADQGKFLKTTSHAQMGHMDEQPGSLQPSRSTPATPTHSGSTLNNKPIGAEADSFFRVIASSQARRLDDQRVALPSLPGISANSERKEKDQKTKLTLPLITVAECTPKSPRKTYPTPTSQPQMTDTDAGSPRCIPKSASFTPETEYQKESSSPGQVTLRLSMSFTPQQGKKNAGQPVAFPELFLTLGAPGDNLIIPLSPVPGRPLSLDLNLVPKEAKSRHCSPRCSCPRKAHSRPLSPYKANSKACSMASSSHEQEKLVTSPISPDEDCFSVIEKVHTAQLQRGSTDAGQKGQVDHGKGREMTEQGKGKVAGKRVRKNVGNKR